MIPSATSGWLNTALPSAAKRMSQLSASSLPPPPTRPSMTAIVAFGIVRIASHIAWNGLSSVDSAAAAGPSVGNCRIRPTSKWAMKKSGLAERNTTTRTSSSAASSWDSSAIARYSPRSNRLIGPLSIVTVATPSTV